MEKACVTCSKTINLHRIPGKEQLYICQNCIKILPKEDSDIHDTCNSICFSCFINPPSFLDISQSTIKKICYNCANNITKSGEKRFINIKWESIVKNTTGISKYNLIKENINSLKKSFKTILDKIDNCRTLIVKDQESIVAKINQYFITKLEIIDKYKKDIENMLTELLIEAKNEIWDGNYMNSNKKGVQLIKSKRSRNLLKDRNICNHAVNHNQIDEALFKLCEIEVMPKADVISDISLMVFIRKTRPIFQIYLDTQTGEMLNIQNQIAEWGNQAAWCSYENGDILYTGGESLEGLSNKSFLIIGNNNIQQVANCVPKKGHSLCYHEGLIYSIGGSLDINERYNRLNDTWERIADPPESFGSSSIVAKYQEILIAPFKRRYFYGYDIRKNAFFKIGNAPINQNLSKLLLKTSDAIFCLSRNNVLMSNSDGRSWKVVSNSIPDLNWCSLGTPSYYDKKFYFILDDFSLYMFSTVDYKAQGIKINKA